MGQGAPRVLEKSINPYLWALTGALVGWGAGVLMGSRERIAILENVAVGVMGAFIGADFVAGQFAAAPAGEGISVSALLLAASGAAVMLVLLRLMRKIVGPLRPGKAKARR